MERLLYTYTYADAAYDDAIRLLATDAQRLLQDATDAGAARAQVIVATLHLPIGRFEVGRDIVITTGDFAPVEVLRGVLPLSWRAAHGEGLFPSMEATLELSALSLDPPITQVTLRGNYTPPLGTVGALGDAAIGHRVAEAAVHRFVVDIAVRLEHVLERATDPA